MIRDVDRGRGGIEGARGEVTVMKHKEGGQHVDRGGGGGRQDGDQGGGSGVGRIRDAGEGEEGGKRWRKRRGFDEG